MKTFRITGKIKNDIVFDKKVSALNKADAFAQIRQELFNFNKQMEVNIEEVRNEIAIE